MRRAMIVSVAVAACMAVISVLCGVAGAVVSLMATVPALAVVSRREAHAELSPPLWKEYLRWVVSTGSFAFYVACFFPLAEFPAITLGLILLSPMFGTSAFVLATALTGLSRTEDGANGVESDNSERTRS